MGEQHSMSQQAAITWYLDSKASVEATNGDDSEGRVQYQPWRAYWPPKCEKTIQTWLHSEFPEVLSWIFDRDLPFDRPWRTWTRSDRALQEQARKMTCQPIREISGKVTIFCSIRDLIAVLVPREPGPQQTASIEGLRTSSDVHDLIDKSRCNAAGCSVFNFLIPLNLYKKQKPYLSRLPSGTTLPRTNIVTESQVLKVFDVSGREHEFELETSGFQYAKSPIHMEYWNDSSVCSEYIPKVEDWLVKHLKCSSAFIYAYNVSLKSRFPFRTTLNHHGVSRQNLCQYKEPIHQDSIPACTLR